MELPISSLRVADSVGDLSAIFDPNVNMVLNRRTCSEEMTAESQSVLRDTGPQLVDVFSPSAGGLNQLRNRLSTFPRIAEEVCLWTEILAELTGCQRVGVRLARVESALCPRFHVDQVILRIVGSFAGSGTEYLRSEDIDRRWLGHAAGEASDETSGLILPGGRIQNAGEGEFLLLKGEAWPDNAERGAVHRSPFASAEDPRLVMTLDPLD